MSENDVVIAYIAQLASARYSEQGLRDAINQMSAWADRPVSTLLSDESASIPENWPSRSRLQELIAQARSDRAAAYILWDQLTEQARDVLAPPPGSKSTWATW